MPRLRGGARLLVLLVLVAGFAAFFASGSYRYLTFENLRTQRDALAAYYSAHPFQTVAAYFAIYIGATGLSLIGAATVLTLLGGAIFGLLWGTLIVSFAASIGATLAFLASRFVLRDWVRQRFGRYLQGIDRGIEKEGAFYLFTLRLIPAVPYFAINLAMGLTPMRPWTFYWVSQIGMLAGTIVYVNAGTHLAAVATPADILSPGLITALVLLGVFPLAAKKTVDAAKARRVYGRWKRPRRYDRNVVVIGGGSAGLVAAYIAAAVRARVTLVEKDRMGGDCLYTGCVPSKALIKSARLLAQMRRAHEYGLRVPTVQFDFAEVMERVQRVVRTVAPHDSAERYSALGVECLHGEARISSPWTVTIDAKQTLTTRAIVIAAGARPLVPRIPGIEQARVLTSDTVWELRELPRRLVVLGGGPVGCELAQAFARFGARVTQVEMLPRLLPREDPDAAQRVRERFAAEGIDVRTAHRAVRVEPGRALICEHAGSELRFEFDALLCALGRVPNTAGYGLEALGIPLAAARTVETNDYLQTLYPNIYACGDVAGPYQFTHTASHQAWYAAVNALFSPFKRFRADYSVIPWATFTDPEVARVGLNETEAKERGVAFEVTRFELAELDRAIADEAAEGMVKVLTEPGSDRILGATIVGEQAGELIVEFITAMKQGIGLNKILGTIHIYPTLAEANKYAAGAWRRAHAPARLLRALERFHAWRRG
ncbi:MAG TPA: FAD-dependent oxidoreductase [Burkholderiales bacterium]|nr:FAD-dependent oxidoreductase [Burkholderiales bacterium]